MSVGIKKAIVLTQSLGFMIFILSSIFRENLSEFMLGFTQGFSIVFILIGLVYMIWCFIKKKNPYNFND